MALVHAKQISSTMQRKRTVFQLDQRWTLIFAKEFALICIILVPLPFFLGRDSNLLREHS